MPRSNLIVTYDVTRYGPLFDGEAQAAVHEWLATAKRDVAETGRTWIQIEAQAFDKSGRGGTGRAAEAVTVSRFGPSGDMRIFGGMIKGEVWWPWLEGTSKRNVGSTFKGYHTFRRTRLRLRRYIVPEVQKSLDAFIGRMGGRAG